PASPSPDRTLSVTTHGGVVRPLSACSCPTVLVGIGPARPPPPRSCGGLRKVSVLGCQGPDHLSRILVLHHRCEDGCCDPGLGVGTDALAAVGGGSVDDEVIDHAVRDGSQGTLAVTFLPGLPHGVEFLATQPLVEGTVDGHVEVGRDGPTGHPPSRFG